MEDQKTIRRHFAVFRNLQQLLDRPYPGQAVSGGVVKQIMYAAKRLEVEVDPNLLPEFDPREQQITADGYLVDPFRAFVGAIVAVLEVELENDEAPVIETRAFSSMHDSTLRQIVERDYQEIQRAFVSQCWKSTIILAGGAIEAVLTDLLLANEPAAKGATKAPKQNDLTKWDLKDLIEVAVELKLVGAGVSKLSHPVREFRNLVHAGNEMRTGLTFSKEVARIAVEVLNMLHRDLHP